MEAEILSHKEIDPAQWDAFIEASPQGMIYHKYHYISALADTWQASVLRNGPQYLAVFPFAMKRKYGIRYTLQPVFAQYWGICLAPMNSKISRAFELRKQHIQAVLEKLPRDIRLFEHSFSPAFDYPLPLLWNKYQLTPRYTYQINLDRPIDDVWSEFAENTRRDIRKAEKSKITVQDHDQFDTIMDIGNRSWGNKIKNVKPEEYARLKRVYEHFRESGESYLLTAMADTGEAAAGILFFVHKDTTIYYFGGTAPEYKHSGAMSLIIWEAIKKAHAAGYKVFDFDGSMIEPIERFLRGFGAVPVPYLSVKKNRLLVWRR
jgi:hypothetical protein